MIESAEIYRSKKGWLMYMPLVITTGIMSVSFSTRAYAAGIISALVVLPLIVPMLLNTKYTISNNNLNVRCGFVVNIDMEIAAITKIEHTRNPLSAPALSLDLLEIFYNKFDSVMISPQDSDNFIARLKNINPAIEVK